MTGKKYSVILLDADDTVFDFGRCERAALRSVLSVPGLPSDGETLAVYGRINLKYWKMLEKKQITKEKLRYARFEEFIAEKGFAADPAVLADGYEKALGECAFLLPGAFEACEKLSEKYDLYVVTNGIGSVQRSRISRSPVIRFFKGYFISDDLGAVKPSAAFFEAVSERIPGFGPASALMVGDSLTSDIAGGINAGIDCCWINPAGLPVPEGMKIDYVIGGLSELPGLLERI